MMIKPKLITAFNAALVTAYPDITISALESPKNKDHGDFATPVCFGLAASWRKSPQDIALTLSDHLNNQLAFSSYATATPINGFINLTLCDSFLWSVVSNRIIDASTFPPSKEKILIEYVSANPTGPLHIGHGRWAVIGSTLTALLRYTGHSVESEFYINDAGNQIRTFYESVDAVKLGKDIPDDGYHGSYIHDLAANPSDPLMANINSQKKTLSRIGVTFDTWFSEKTLYDTVPSTLQLLTDQGWTFEKEGALWFTATKWGDEKDRVLVKADGSYTYFALDIVYHHDKLKRDYTQLINIWGADHHGYVARVNAAILALSSAYNLTVEFSVIIGQLVNLIRDGQPVRMSKRTGDMISLDEVIDDIGADATRYFLIEHQADTHLDFHLNLAKTQSSENPVYYIQYAHARLCQLFKKYPDLSQQPSIHNLSTMFELQPIEHQLLLYMAQWPDVAYFAACQRQPYHIAQYCVKLSRLFHSFYEQCPISTAEKSIQLYRMSLLREIQSVLQDALSILGISAPDRM